MSPPEARGVGAHGARKARRPISELFDAWNLRALWRARKGAAIPVALLAALALGGCQWPTFGAYRGATTQGQTAFRMWSGAAIAALSVGAVVWLLIFWSILRYRRKGDDEMPKQFHDHRIIEIVYTALPIMIIIGLFYFTVISEDSITAVSDHPAIQVKITAFQWGWQYDYYAANTAAAGILDGHAHPLATVSGSDESFNAVPPVAPMPVGETIKVTLVSTDVVHGFYVPAFNFSRYAQPGWPNTFDLNIVSPGLYDGRCTQYCGEYHTEMRFAIKADTPQVFDAWLASHHHATAANTT